MNDQQDVSFTMNGDERTIGVEPRCSFADLLREDCGDSRHPDDPLRGCTIAVQLLSAKSAG